MWRFALSSSRQVTRVGEPSDVAPATMQLERVVCDGATTAFVARNATARVVGVLGNASTALVPGEFSSARAAALLVGARLFVLVSPLLHVYDVADLAAPPLTLRSPAWMSGALGGSLAIDNDEPAPQHVFWVDGGFVAALSLAPRVAFVSTLASSDSRADLMAHGFVPGDDDDGGDALFVPSGAGKAPAANVWAGGQAAVSGRLLVFAQTNYFTAVDCADPTNLRVLLTTELADPPIRFDANVALRGDFLHFVADKCEFTGQCFNSLAIAHVDTAAKALRVVGVDADFASTRNGEHVDLLLRGNTVVTSAGPAVFDVTDRTKPTHTALADAQSLTMIGAPRCADIAGCTAEKATGGSASRFQLSWWVLAALLIYLV